jgi:apolipoprotein N-acyltransferase
VTAGVAGIAGDVQAPGDTVMPWRHRGRGRLAGPGLASGVLLALSLPPWGWWPLGFAGAALLYWRLAGLRLRERLWVGWVAGLGCFAIGLFWARAFNWYGAVVLILVEALFFAAAGALTPPARGRALAFVGACTLAECVRMAWPFGGLPIGGVWLGQAGGPLLPLARLGGPLLLTAAVWAGGVVVATAGSWAVDRQRGGSLPAPAGAVAFALAVVLLTVAGAAAPDGGAPVRELRVALVQGGGQRGLSKEQVPPARVYRAQLAATLPLTTAHPGPGLVLWPENVVALDRPLDGSPQAASLSRLARRFHATLVAGITQPAGDSTFRNQVIAWGPDGRIVAVFEKVHRVPFGEYVPDRSFFAHFADLSGVPTDAVPGNGTGLMRTPAGPLGLLVSFEVFYAGRSHQSVRAGAELLAVPTNTSSYSSSQVPSQEIAAAKVQAVQTGRDLVQAAPTGFSAIVTQRGEVLARSALGTRQVITGTVGLRRGLTPYDHWGDLPVLALALLALVLGWVRQWRWPVVRGYPGGPARTDAS